MLLLSSACLVVGIDFNKVSNNNKKSCVKSFYYNVNLYVNCMAIHKIKCDKSTNQPTNQPGTREMSQWLKVLALMQRTRVQFSVPLSYGSQTPVAPAPNDLFRHPRTHARTHTNKIK